MDDPVTLHRLVTQHEAEVLALARPRREATVRRRAPRKTRTAPKPEGIGHHRDGALERRLAALVLRVRPS